MEHQYTIVDGVLTPKATQHNFVPEGSVVYEVVRLIDGKPLFWHEHYVRLIESCRIAQLKFNLQSSALTTAIQALVKANRTQSINLKLEVFIANSQLHYLMYFIPSQYPDNSLYSLGISLGVLHQERINPQAKVVNTLVRDRANDLIKKGNYFEVLLVNDKGEITEGSRSNVFFIKGSALITPPVADVLPGITRSQVLKIAQNIGLAVSEEAVNIQDATGFDLIFITGTSPMLLPASCLEKFVFNTNNVMFQSLLSEYRSSVMNDLTAFDY